MIREGTFIRVPFGASRGTRVAFVVRIDRRGRPVVTRFNAAKWRWLKPAAMDEENVIDHDIPVRQMPRGIFFPREHPRAGARIKPTRTRQETTCSKTEGAGSSA